MATKVQNRSTKGDEVLMALPLACTDEAAAVAFIEKQRWGDQPACPCCGSVAVYQMRDSKTGERQVNFRWRCKDCRQQYSCRRGTVFEDSRIELRHWCFAFWRASTSKKGVSALEIHRQTGISYKSCLFMLNRIRFAMDDSATPPLSGIVEVDEVYIGGKPRFDAKLGRKVKKPKQAVVALVQRGGHVKTKPVADVTSVTLKQAIRENVHCSARIMTDGAPAYRGIGMEFAGGHEVVEHERYEYARGDVTTNTVEGFFSIVKRGLNGIYHAVSKEHLHRYMSEYEFRYNRRHMDDGPRTVAAIKGAEGKRLTYKASIGRE